jgi:hypothetical protein
MNRTLNPDRALTFLMGAKIFDTRRPESPLAPGKVPSIKVKHVPEAIINGTYWERAVCVRCKLLKINNKHGGGGGSRTPVRKALRAEDYMLSSIQFVSPAALRMSKKRNRLVRWFSPGSYGPKDLGQPAE